MKIIKKLVSYFFFLLLIPFAHAEWVGPSQVLSGNWGDGPQEFFVDWGDVPAYAIFPGILDVSSDGWIVIGDEDHFKFYAPNGEWVRNLSLPYGFLRFVGSNMVLQGKNYLFLSRTGENIKQFPSPTLNLAGKSVYLGEHNDRLYVAVSPPSERWLAYSPDGMLLETLTQKPLDLGRIKEDLFRYQGEKLRRVTVSFPIREWVIAGREKSCGEYNYFVDNTGFLYCLGTKKVMRYSACGVQIAALDLPKENIITINAAPIGSGAEDNMEIVESFGEFEIADNGDLYSSRVTQQEFSVMRWAWQDSPSDPIGGPAEPLELAVSSNEGGVTLQWVRSLQDPGCVTGYEVGRSTETGGPYILLSTVSSVDVDQPYTFSDNTAQSGSTYYYAVRSVSAIARSPYSNEVSALVE